MKAIGISKSSSIQVKGDGTSTIWKMNATKSKNGTLRSWQQVRVTTFRKQLAPKDPQRNRAHPFPVLHTLMVSGNKIVSIEAIHCLFLPNLREFWINHKMNDRDKPNFLVSLRSLRKVNWPNLQTISLSNKSSMKAATRFRKEKSWLGWIGSPWRVSGLTGVSARLNATMFDGQWRWRARV